MVHNVRIRVWDSNKTEVVIDGKHIESDICRYELDHEAGSVPVLHLYIPFYTADIEIEQCEVEENEKHSGV